MTSFRPVIQAAIVAVLLLAAAPASASPSACGVTGTVLKAETVSKSPWADGTPSAISVAELRVTLAVEKREADRRAPGSSCPPAAKQVSYKICSPVTIKAGDRIRGTEGAPPLAAADAICLFDIAVLPPQP
jgi:hypothetical protein